MTDKPKTPPAKKTIQDPPEYAAVPGEAALKKAPKGSLSGGSGDWLGGPQNGEEEKHLGDWLGGPQNGAEAPASKDEERSHGEGVRNPQTDERIARNPQTGE
ncbi:hypothetical protein [Rhizobium ruizarguesonis]|uniref:hypothetical protein n=1 Tax=Rhizobium ruizarguesonis TaxID=2081791 RepID=UPI0019534AA6|nr:hypothetical protein [Rhizobium ruizarguesonis]